MRAHEPPPIPVAPRIEYAGIGGTPQGARDQIGAVGPVLPNLNPGLGDTLVWDGTSWTVGAGGGGGLEFFTTRTLALKSIAGEPNYRIPVGLWFKSGVPGSETTTLTINGIEQFLGADYGYVGRFSPPPTVVDCVFGFSLAGSPPAGWDLVFTWQEGFARIAPPTVLLQRLINPGGGWEPDFSVPGNGWLPTSVVQAPNGVMIPPPPAPYVVEFWRESAKRGGTFLTPAGHQVWRNGRRYVPYFRGPSTQSVEPTTFHSSEFASTRARPWQKFRVCYYNPLTGARSALSAETIIVIGGLPGIGGVPDQVGTFGLTHVAGSVMIKR